MIGRAWRRPLGILWAQALLQTTHMSADTPPPRARPLAKRSGHAHALSGNAEARPRGFTITKLARSLGVPLIAAALLAGCGGSHHPAASTTVGVRGATLNSGDVAVVGSRQVTHAMYDQALTEDRVDLTSAGTAIPAPGRAPTRR